MTANEIERTTQTLEERGMPQNSYFAVIFTDGSELTEKEANWSSFCEKKEVDYFDIKKLVSVSKYPLKKISCFHEGLEASIDVPEDCEAYQALRGEALIVPEHGRKDRIVGRIIGIIKDGVVVEEIFIDAIQLKLTGFKK
jgi:hypothetical protein